MDCLPAEILFNIVSFEPEQWLGLSKYFNTISYYVMDSKVLQEQALYHACSEGHVDLLNKLLACPDVDPTKEIGPSLVYTLCLPLTVAASRGHTEVVKRLLQDVRVDPTSNNNAALWCAAGQCKEVLLRDPRVDRSDILTIAMKRSDIHMIQLVLRDRRVDKSTDNLRVLLWALENGHQQLVQQLCQDSTLDTSLDEEMAV